MLFDQDCLNYSDDAFRVAVDKIAHEQEQRRRQLRREYAKNRVANYVEYQRRKGSLHWKP